MNYTGIHPFWFWNGEITKDELKRQIQEMADKGIDGFFIHSRQGLSVPYLSKQYFELVDFTVKEASKSGLSVHLYDEYPYPSGVAGGQVILGSPEYMATYLIQKEYKLSGGSIKLELPKGRILNCTIFPIKNKIILWDQSKDIKTSTGILLNQQTYHETGLTSYNRKRFLATNPCPYLSIDLPKGHYLLSVSIQALIETNKYWGYFSDILNPKAVKEFIKLTHQQYKKHLGNYFGKQIFSIFTDEIEPGWSSIIPKAFKKQYGYDLLEKLPALHLEDHPENFKIKSNLTKLVKKLFIRCFEKPVRQWCKQHKINYCGEKPVFHLSQLSFMDIPGCEPGHTKAGALPDLLGTNIRQNAKSVSSAAYFYNKKGSLCECLHSLGWGATLLDAKIIMEGLALLGITMIVPHGFFYSTHGLAKHDAPPSFFFQMPYWPLMKQLSQRITNLNHQFSKTKINAQILLYEPSESFPDHNERQIFRQIQYTLMENHLDFLIADQAILKSTKKKFKLLIIPPLKHPGEKLLSILSKLDKAGTVILQTESNVKIEKITKKVMSVVNPSLKFKISGNNPSRLWMVSRISKNNKKSWFFLNTEDQELEIIFDSKVKLTEITLDSNSIPALKNNKRKIKPFESFFIKEEIKETKIELPIINIDIPKQLEVIPVNSNLLRLAEWDLSLLDNDNTILETHQVQAKPIIQQLSDGKFKFTPNYLDRFGCSPELYLPEMNLCYTTTFMSQFEEKVELVIEPGSIAGKWFITINNNHCITPNDFKKTDTHVHGSLGVDISNFIKTGLNTININVKTNKPDQGLLSAIFLAGNFNVFDNTLHNSQGTGGFEDYIHNGLSFYSGIIKYEFTHSLNKPESEEALCIFSPPEEFQQALGLSINNSPFYNMPWPPYQCLIPTKIIKQGKNNIILQVYTSLERSFEGTYFDASSHEYKMIKRL